MAMISEFLGQLTLNFGVGIPKIRNKNINDLRSNQVDVQSVTLHLF